MATDTSENIVKLLRERNEKGLSLLFDRYSNAIMGLLTRMLKDQHIAEEVLQTTFLRAWERIDKYDESKAALYTWLYAIARNAALDVIRLKSFERRSMSQPIENVNAEVSSTYIPTAGIDTNKLLNSIEVKYREVLDCLYLQGYSQRETAEKLNIPLGTVKSRLRVGMKNIRNEIGSESTLFWAFQIVIIITLLILWSLGKS